MKERDPHDLRRARHIGAFVAAVAAAVSMVTIAAPADVAADDPPPELPPNDDPAGSIAVSVEDPVPICPPGVVGHPDQVLTERCYAPAFGFAGIGPATFPAAITWETLGFNPSNSSPFRVSWPLSPYPRCVIGEDEVYPCRSGEVDELGRTNNVVAWVFNRGNQSSSGIRLMAHENCDADLWCDIVLLPQVTRFGQPAIAETFAGDDLIVEVRANITTSPLAGQSVLIRSQQRYEITGGGPPPPSTAPTASFTAEASSPRSLAWNFDASASEGNARQTDAPQRCDNRSGGDSSRVLRQIGVSRCPCSARPDADRHLYV